MYGIPVEVLSYNGMGFICPKIDRTAAEHAG
jgi:hypothetical protein